LTFGKPAVNLFHFLLTENIKKGNQEITVELHYLIQNVTQGVRGQLCKLQKKRCTRLATASDKVYQLLAHGWWFPPGTPTSSTTKTLAMI
jgi:hypothetical protein